MGDGNHWTVFNGAGAVVCDNMPMDVARAYLTPERAKRGWNAVYCLVVRDPGDFPSPTSSLGDAQGRKSPAGEQERREGEKHGN